MFLITSIRNPVGRLLHWLQHRWRAEQWLVDRTQITPSTTLGWRRRVLLSRSVCLFYIQDLSHVPAARRTAALAQQVKLLSPFTEPGFYAHWQAGKVRLWLWDQAALVARLPEAARILVLPDSALSLLGASTELASELDLKHPAAQPLDGLYVLQGISGQEQQRWHQGELQDSRWLPQSSAKRQAPSDELEQDSAERLIVLDLHRAAPLQAADKRLLGHLALGAIASILLAIFLLQAGGALSLWQQQNHLNVQMQQHREQNQAQQQAMRQVLATRERWQARQTLLEQPGQLGYVQQLAKVLPNTAQFWQRYSYEPGRLQLLLVDAEPDPRDYVRIISKLPNTQNVQVQLDPANQKVTIQAELTASLHASSTLGDSQ